MIILNRNSKNNKEEVFIKFKLNLQLNILIYYIQPNMFQNMKKKQKREKDYINKKKSVNKMQLILYI